MAEKPEEPKFIIYAREEPGGVNLIHLQCQADP